MRITKKKDNLLTVKKQLKTPGQIGGKLIRAVIKTLKINEVTLPIDSHILCAVSGGPDSVALASLICSYGKKIAPKGVSLLHVNHNWRGEESLADEQFVKELGKKLGVPVIVKRLKQELQFVKGESPEERARFYRKEVYQTVAKEEDASFVLTGHHLDDTAETVLWKLMTGAPRHEWSGIYFRSENELRPFISVPKVDLIRYLKEEGLTYRTDSTNSDPKYLRAKIRTLIVPALDQVFPKWRVRLTELTKGDSAPILPAELGGLLDLGQIKARGKHWQEAIRQAKRGQKTEVDLPNGAKLTHNIKEGSWTLKSPRTNEGKN